MKEDPGNHIIAQLLIIGYDDYLVIEGKRLMKVFVEIPASKEKDIITMISSAMASNSQLASMILEAAKLYNKYNNQNN